jgi:excisionase family DNA binding protein
MRNLQLLTCAEVAKLLRVSRETVRQLAAAGELPGRKIGRAWRFPKSAVESFAFDIVTQVPRREIGADEFEYPHS